MTEKSNPMKLLPYTLFLLILFGHPCGAAPAKDPHLEALFEQMEEAPPRERKLIRREIRHYLKTQKRIQRRKHLELMRRECEGRHGPGGDLRK
jgi:hypothetical protein